MYKGKLYGLMTDGDTNSFFMRRDWLEDQGNQRAFEDKFGYPLKKPVLYEEYFDQVKFFTNPAKERYGAWVFVSPFYAKWEFLQLLVPRGVLPFDEDMRPLVAGPEGVEALEELISLKPYLHPGCTTGGWDHQYKAMAAGTVYCTITWPSLIKYMNFPDYSKIVEKVVVCQVPGRKLKNGTVLRPARFTSGWQYIVSRYSKNPELAYLYAQWMYSPKISAKVIPMKGTYFDLFRYSHMENEELLKLYDPKYWKDLKEPFTLNVENCYPEIMLKGGAEYMLTLDENVIAAFQGMKKPKDALNETAENWEKITERYGRESQKEQWQSLRSCHGANLRKALNLPEPPEWIKKI
jgi:multiple sugar transport system substrate-binding protein